MKGTDDIEKRHRGIRERPKRNSAVYANEPRELVVVFSHDTADSLNDSIHDNNREIFRSGHGNK